MTSCHLYLSPMSAKVVPLRQTGPIQLPNVQELVARIRALAAEENASKHIFFDHPHFQLRLRQRGLNMRQVLETVREGEPIGKPTLDPYGDWRIKLKRIVAGRRVQVVVAVKADHIVLVTPI